MREREREREEREEREEDVGRREGGEKRKQKDMSLELLNL